MTKRFHGLVAVNDVTFTLAPRRDPRPDRPERRRQDHARQPDQRHAAADDGRDPVRGQSLDALPAFRRAQLGIGRTFQVMKPFPGMSVLENVAGRRAVRRERRRAQPRRAAREQARESLEFVGLGKRSRAARRRSSAAPDRKRLELAKALAMQPRLLLLDEVMAGLNHVEIEEVIEVIRKVRERGITSW